MCDADEAELEEYLAWIEASRAPAARLGGTREETRRAAAPAVATA